MWTSLMISSSLLVGAAAALTSPTHQRLEDLQVAFTTSNSLSHPDHIKYAALHETQTSSCQECLMLACAPYGATTDLEAIIIDYPHHPVFSSYRDNRICYLVNFPSASPKSVPDDIKVTPIPHILKIGDSVDRLVSTAPTTRSHRVLELSLGLGVRGLASPSDKSKVAKDIVAHAEQLLFDEERAAKHWNKFYWTSDSAPTLWENDPSVADDQFIKRRSKYRATTSIYCDFSTVEIHESRSHVHFVFPSASEDMSISSVRTHESCMLLLTSIAALHEKVSYISAYDGYEKQKVTSMPYNNGSLSTDQNAWLQSGNSKDTPYSKVGLNGEGYVLGMIDSGVDDMSCFMIDDSRTPIPRTQKNHFKNPITESHRRKVIQYVAYADGIPDMGFDHGTWCAGASVGKCINPKKLHGADAFNGLATEAKLTMFDVQTNGKMFVPSLYDIALPPAYVAGARVHSNSWGCRGITSYTSKALDIDEFMFEHSDFLFVVAAGNDGALGMDSVGSPGVSKNALTVGASAEDHNDIVYFSGIGKAFDGIIKPDVIGPGTNLMSAGVGNAEDETCNVQLSSGTSMATPLISGVAVLVKQYFEQSDYWGKSCNAMYRSCPRKLKNAKGDRALKSSHSNTATVSSALVKAVIIHSAMDMKKILSLPNSVVPTANLTRPPDRFQGWGQVIMKNVLPLPGLYDFDLYYADYEVLVPMTRRQYTAVVKNKQRALVVTIAWNDPPNVVWAAKNLLNDFDLAVVSPSGEVFYGNNRKGDEFNAVERVVIEKPEKGAYSILVTAKHFAVGYATQKYSVVISSNGYVQESMTFDTAVTHADLDYDSVTESCHEKKGNLVRMQLEDWMAGVSWNNIFFTISKGSEGSVGETVYIRTFRSNHDVRDSSTNRIDQFSVCLQPDTKYVARITDLAMPDDVSSIHSNVNLVRVIAPDCDIALSSHWQQTSIVIENNQCNECPSSSEVVTVIMMANNTDDDSSDYSWYGKANYEIHSIDNDGESTGLVMGGTLVVSDESGDRLCLPRGMYAIRLNDGALYAERQKHAFIKVKFTDPTMKSIRLYGTRSAAFRVGPPSWIDASWLWAGFYSILGVAVVIGCLLCLQWRRGSSSQRSAPGGSSTEMRPLLR